jgi:hypothetical protein
MESHIYSKLDYEEAVSAKKNILEMQKNLLNSINKIESYKDLRKKELILKLKMKNNFKNIDDHIKKINNHLPETKSIKHIKIVKAKGEKEVKRNLSIQEQLLDIQKRLSELQ